MADYIVTVVSTYRVTEAESPQAAEAAVESGDVAPQTVDYQTERAS